MDARSPLFPASALTPGPGADADSHTLVPQLPRLPHISTSTLQAYIVPAEKHLFVQGFKPVDFELRPPTLLRGALVIRVLKPNKIKSIGLNFKGVQKTEWPEGIPPKRAVYMEENQLISHSWPFYNVDSHMPGYGADIVVPPGRANAPEDVSHLSLDAQVSAAKSSLTPVRSSSALYPDSHTSSGLGSGVGLAASIMKMAASTTNSLSPVNSYIDPVASAPLSGSGSERPGVLAPGDYVYNFEHPIPASSPETISANFGSVNYHLEVDIYRSTTFKSHLSARLPITVVRVASDNSVEENEPIVIERDWEDQMRYEIVVASKSVVLDSYLPISLRFVPLFGKVALHRIRVYISEDCSYYCGNKSVHRTEPSRKYLLLEHKAKKHQSLLSKSGGRAEANDIDDEVLPRELEFQLYVPSVVNKKFDYHFHPDTAVDNIQSNHWIKISLRISKRDPENPEKRKHFEISIDSPIHLFSPLAAHNNTLLPVYQSEHEFLPEYTQAPPLSPGVTTIDVSHPQNSQSLMSVFGSPQNTPSEPERATTPVHFQRIAGTIENQDPLQRDNDLHLESNLFKPENDETLNAIGSPQATPFTPVGSPFISPVRGPVSPSMDPPSFNITSVTEDTLPPAYEAEPRGMSLSPLRLDSPNGARELSPVPGGSGGIKSLLNKQFESRGRRGSDVASLGTNGSSSKSHPGDVPVLPVAGRQSLESKHSQKSSQSQNSQSSEQSKQGKGSLQVNQGRATDRRDRSVSPAPLSLNVSSGQDAAVDPLAKTIVPQNLKELDVNSKIGTMGNSLGVPDINVSAHTDGTHRGSVSSHSSLGDPSTDITELGSPALQPAQPYANSNSSVSSLNYRRGSLNESDIDLTLPLLTSTNTRNDNRFSIDSDRNFDPMGSMNDLVTTTRFDDLRIPTFGSFRNPRLNKHYQDETPATEEHDLAALSNRSRQKSFGVMSDFHKQSSQSDNETDESRTTLNEIEHSPKDLPYSPPDKAHHLIYN